MDKNKIITICVIVSVILTVWFLMYMPYKKESAKIKAELVQINKQAGEIEERIGRAKAMRLVREKREALYSAFPSREEEGLRILFDLAKILNISIVSVEPKPKEVFRDSDNNKITKGKKTCRKVFISLRIKCSYADLVKYIQTLKNALSGFITFERITIEKEKGKRSQLKVTLDINLYILS